MRKNIILTLPFVFVISTAAWAQAGPAGIEFRIADDTPATSMYVALGTVKKSEVGTASIWVLVNFKNTIREDNGTTIKSSLSRLSFQCFERLYKIERYLGWDTKNGGGIALANKGADPDFSPIEKGSSIAGVMFAACDEGDNVKAVFDRNEPNAKARGLVTRVVVQNAFIE